MSKFNKDESRKCIEQLCKIVGKSHVFTDDQHTRQYRQGRRFGEGKVFAVVCPGTLLQQWQVLQVAMAADCIVIMQAANNRKLKKIGRILKI